MDDLISRQAAIDALHMHLMYRMGTDSNKKRLDDWINGVPSAQPETHDKRTETHECVYQRTETHACDCISRQAAIDLIRSMESDATSHGISPRLTPSHVINGIESLLSAQPEPCEDTVSRQRLLSDLKELVAAWKKYPVMAKQIKGVEAAIEYVEAIPSAQPGTARRIVGKSRDGITLWYQCDMCNEPVDAQDNFCRGCGRRLTDG